MTRLVTLTIKIERSVKKRLERLAESTGRNRSLLVAEAIKAHLDVNEWQVAGTRRAMAALDRGTGIPHQRVKDWTASWGTPDERPAPKR